MRRARVGVTVRLPGGTVLSATDEHLVAAADETAWAAVADVITCADASRPAVTRVRALLARHPGCLVAVARDTGGRCVIGTRDGRLIEAPAGDPAALGSITHAWLLAVRLPGHRGGGPPGTAVTAAGPAPPAVPGHDRPAATRDRRRSPARG